MHVHERNPKRTLITILLFAFIIVAGWLTMKKPRFEYALTPQQTVDMVVNNRGVFHLYELSKVINDKSKVVLIDIRNNFDFAKGHIPNSLNITAINLLDKENIEQLNIWKENNVKVVFYHDTQLQANGTWMLFRQIGYSNTYVLQGGYNCYALNKENLNKAEDKCLKGVAKYNFAEVAKKSGAAVVDNGSKPSKKVKVRRKKKEKAASGGC